MPEVVPLVRIYNALDSEAYQAFRAAMRRSRGGVVRSADLLAGLAECQPRATAAVLALDPDVVTALARPPMSDPDLVPMANEPSLSETLAAAYRAAAGRSITPAHLLLALTAAGPARAPMPRPAVAFQETSETPLGSPLVSLGPADWTEDDAAAILTQWLLAQVLPVAERDDRVERIARNPGGQRRPLV